MTMVTVPLAVLIGAAIGLLTSGGMIAAENNECGEYTVVTIICCMLFVVVCCGLETLIKAGGA